MVQLADVQAAFKGFFDMSWQMLRFGPILSSRMTLFSIAKLPSGLAASGAETVKEGVDHDDAQGVAVMTASMVRMGLLWLVHDIVVTLCDQDRPDAVAATTVGLLQLGEMDVINQINMSLLESGHMQQVAQIAGGLVAQGHTELTDIAKQAMGWEDPKDQQSNKKDGQDETVMGSLQQAGRKAVESVSGQKPKPDDTTDAHTSRGQESQPGWMETIQKKSQEALAAVSGSQQEKDPSEEFVSEQTRLEREGAKMQEGSTAKDAENSGQSVMAGAADAVRHVFGGQPATS